MPDAVRSGCRKTSRLKALPQVIGKVISCCFCIPFTGEASCPKSSSLTGLRVCGTLAARCFSR